VKGAIWITRITPTLWSLHAGGKLLRISSGSMVLVYTLARSSCRSDLPAAIAPEGGVYTQWGIYALQGAPANAQKFCSDFIYVESLVGFNNVKPNMAGSTGFLLVGLRSLSPTCVLLSIRHSGCSEA